MKDLDRIVIGLVIVSMLCLWSIILWGKADAVPPLTTIELRNSGDTTAYIDINTEDGWVAFAIPVDCQLECVVGP